MHDNSTKKYKIEDLPTFFNKDKSKKISKAFSDKEIEISTICSQLISDKKQKFSFKLKLLKEDQRAAVQSKDEEDQRAAVRRKTGSVITFFKICLKDEKEFRSKLGVSQEDKELKEKYIKNKGKIFLHQFIKDIPIAAISRGITIKLYADVGDIDLDKLDKLKSSLDEKLLLATENKQTVPTDNSCDGTLTKIVAPSSQPTITPATERVPTYTAAPQTNAINMQQSVDCITAFEASRKASEEEKKAEAEHIIKTTIMQAQNEARIALLGIDFSTQKETLDKIFITIVREYTTQYEEWVKGQVE